RDQAALDIGARYARQILTNVYASVGVSYQLGRDGQRNGHDISLSLRRSFARGLVGDVRVYQSVDSAGTASTGALFAVSWQLGDGHSFVQSGYDTASDTLQAAYQYSPTNYIGELGGALNVVRHAGDDQISGSV